MQSESSPHRGPRCYHLPELVRNIYLELQLRKLPYMYHLHTCRSLRRYGSHSNHYHQGHLLATPTLRCYMSCCVHQLSHLHAALLRSISAQNARRTPQLDFCRLLQLSDSCRLILLPQTYRPNILAGMHRLQAVILSLRACSIQDWADGMLHH